MNIRKKPLSSNEFKHIYSKVPRITVIPLIHTSQGILLTLRNIDPAKNRWHFAGGTVYFNDSIVEALKRVAMDELGVSIKVVKFLGTIQYFKTKNDAGHAIALVYLVTTNDKITLNKEASDFGYFLNPTKDMVEEEADFMRRYLSNTL